MLMLTFMACVLNQPNECKDVSLNFEAAALTPQSCMMDGQMEMAKWLEEHPNYVIKKWRCGRPEKAI